MRQWKIDIYFLCLISKCFTVLFSFNISKCLHLSFVCRIANCNFLKGGAPHYSVSFTEGTEEFVCQPIFLCVSLD